MGAENITTIADNARSYLMTLSIDTVIFLVLFGIIFLLGLRIGKYGLIRLILSTYVALILFINFPYHSSIPWDFGTLLDKFDIVNSIVLLLMIGVVNSVIRNITESDFELGGMQRWITTGILSFSLTILFLASLYITGIATLIYGMESPLNLVFTTPLYLFSTLIIPLVGIYLTIRQ